MEDSAHLGTFARQLIVLSDSLLCLQHRDVNASLLHKVQRGSWNLGGGQTGTLSQNTRQRSSCLCCKGGVVLPGKIQGFAFLCVLVGLKLANTGR